MPRKAPAHWQSRSLPAALLLPLTAVFAFLSALRRVLYRLGVLRAERVAVPVVVVGNIAVGGSGKTPVVEWLVRQLRAAGYQPGIVSRGYGGKVKAAAVLTIGADPKLYGDEPVLLARLTACPVAVGADRPAAVRALLAAHPGCDVIVSDDGLQHYRLGRDVEVVVLDEATLGNRLLMPAGPLREGLARLREVDVVIAHGDLSAGLSERLCGQPVFAMHLAGAHFRRLDESGELRPAQAFKGMPVHAVAGIGRPERFFAQLCAMGIDVHPHPFPDHHHYTPGDLDFAPGEPKVMTSKDAVKCASFAPPDSWEFPVQAHIAPGAAERILEKLAHGRQTA